MSNLLWKTLLAAPVAGVAFAVSSVAVAAESAPSLNVSAEPIQLAQVTSVSELADVSPSDWAFQSLQSLVENYGCIQGYPDRTFRGNRSLTRYEFAAGLNACLDVMAVLISQSGVNPDDLAAIRRLQEEFQAELATLRGRVDALEAETATLRAQQFSTTTKLSGQADAQLIVPFNTTGVAPNALFFGSPAIGVDDSASFEGRARLNFDSSFTGDDLLRIRLQAGSGANALTGAALGGLGGLGGLANSGGAGYDVTVDDFYYRFPVGSRVDVTVAARGLSGDDWVTSTIVPYDGPGVADASGPRFYDDGGLGGFGGPGANGPGAGVNIAFTDSLILDLGYSSSASANLPNQGIFNGPQSVIAQLNYLPDSPFSAAITYMQNNLSNVNFLGSPIGRVNTYAGLIGLDFDRFVFGGHLAFQNYNGGDDVSWTIGAGVNDLLLEGSQLGVYGGQLPNSLDPFGSVIANNPVLVEGYYSIPVNEFLTVTPALIYGDGGLNVPGFDSKGLWGVIRTTFRF